MNSGASMVAETKRLNLRRVNLDDAPFIVELLSEPGWLRYIGDKGVKSISDAHRYLQTGPLAMYERHGFGLYVVERKQDATSIGLCGLIKRDGLKHADIGFAFLARASGQGFALEAATATLVHARALGLERLLAITTPDNDASQKLLRKLGMRFERAVQLAEGAERLHLYSVELMDSNRDLSRANIDR